MKSRNLYLAVICILISATFLKAQDNATKKLLLKLQPGETIVTNESSLNLTSSGNKLYLVTWIDKMFYIYEDGIRKGPFQKPEEVKLKSAGENKNIECSVYKNDNVSLPQEYVVINDEAKYTIQFKGKTYGPFMMIVAFFKSSDNSSFAAVTTDEHMSFYLVTSEGINQKLNGTFERFITSPSGNQYLLLVKEGATVDMAALSTMSEEEMMKYMQEYAQQQQNAGEPQMQIITNGGKLVGKYQASKLYSDNPAYCITGGDNWYMIIDNNLYVNGTIVWKDDKSIYLSGCKIWLSKDGKRFAISDYSKIIFSDGSSFPPAIHLEIEKAGDKTILKWIALENETDLVIYSKEL